MPPSQSTTHTHTHGVRQLVAICPVEALEPTTLRGGLPQQTRENKRFAPITKLQCTATTEDWLSPLSSLAIGVGHGSAMPDVCGHRDPGKMVRLFHPISPFAREFHRTARTRCRGSPDTRNPRPASLG